MFRLGKNVSCVHKINDFRTSKVKTGEHNTKPEPLRCSVMKQLTAGDSMKQLERKRPTRSPIG